MQILKEVGREIGNPVLLRSGKVPRKNKPSSSTSNMDAKASATASVSQPSLNKRTIDEPANTTASNIENPKRIRRETAKTNASSYVPPQPMNMVVPFERATHQIEALKAGNHNVWVSRARVAAKSHIRQRNNPNASGKSFFMDLIDSSS